MSYPIEEPPDQLPPWPASARCICGGITLPASEGELRPELPEQNYNHRLSSSPFASRFDTNYAASTEEAPQLRSLIDEQKVEIELTTQKILDLQREIIRLCRENEPRRTFVQKHEAFLAPIRRLPVDLLREIFAHCLSPTAPGSMHKDDAPMVLTRVCSAWRRLALSTPLLWSSIHVAIPPSLPPWAPDPVLPRIAAIYEWLSRSGSTPLRVSIYQENTRRRSPGCEETGVWFEHDNKENMERILNALRPAIPRFETLSLTCPLESTQVFFDIPGSEWNSIHELVFFNKTPGYSNVSVDPLSTSGPTQLGPLHAPHLSKVTLLGVLYTHDPFTYAIPWDRITTLCLSGGAAQPSPMAYFNLLANISRTIESLDIDIYPTAVGLDPDRWSDSSLPEVGIVTLPRLKQLALKERCIPFTALAKSIRCPVLEHLSYDETLPTPYSPILYPSDTQPTPQEGQQTHIGSLITLLSHSGALIKTIWFNHLLYTNQQLLDIFSSLPLVERISHLDSVAGPPSPQWAHQANDPPAENPLAKGVFHAFVTPQDPSSPNSLPYCPLLKHLTWGSTTASDVDFLEFLELKQSGTLEGVAKLDTVSIHFKSLSGERCKRMRELFANPWQAYLSCPRVASDYDSSPPIHWRSSIRNGLYAQGLSWPVTMSASGPDLFW